MLPRGPFCAPIGGPVCTPIDSYYVQCRYGARALTLDGTANAVFVAKLADVASALTAFEAAVASGELDKAIAETSKRKQA